MKRTYLFYGEGRKDRKFIERISRISQFKHKIGGCSFLFGNSSGGHPSKILRECVKYISGREFDVIICFIDLDKLKEECSCCRKGSTKKYWVSEKTKLEDKYKEYGIKIFWHEDNLEDEICRVIPRATGKGKSATNQMALSNITKFINSNYWKRIFLCLRSN